MNFKKLTILLIILFFAMTAVSANENINSATNGTTASFEIDESNYNDYFDINTGKINDNSGISSGNNLKLGNMTGKIFYIDKCVNITTITPNDKLINSEIKFVSGSEYSKVRGITIINNENSTLNEAILIKNVNNITIEYSYLEANSSIKYNLVIDSSNYTNLNNITFKSIKSKNLEIINSNSYSINNCAFESDLKNIVVENIFANDLVKIEKNESRFEAKFSNLANDNAQFIINNVTYERKTNSNGTAQLAINLEHGEYIIQSINPKTGETKENTITVLPRIVENYDLEKFYRNSSQYVIKVLDDNGNPASENETVIFNINGVFYNRTTNASGHVKLNINLQPGNYIITAEYKGCKSSNNVKVKNVLFADDLTKNYGAKDQFKVKLVDGNGNPLSSKNITFNINGVFYNRTTDENGVANLNINLMSGEYIITSSYDDCNLANKITVKGN